LDSDHSPRSGLQETYSMSNSTCVIPRYTAIPNSAHRNVSLKVIVAEKSGEFNHELHILMHLKESSDSSHPGHKYVSHLLDFFYFDGPNGRHLYLIFDVLGPNMFSGAERCTDYRLDGCLARDISAQVLLAVDYLHSSGIVHGGEPILTCESNCSR